MRILITSFVIIFGLMSPSFGENTNIRFLEKKQFENSVLVNRMCIGGYEFVVLCKDYYEKCAMSKEFNFQLTQIITEEGGGKKC